MSAALQRGHDTGELMDEGTYALGRKTGEWVTQDGTGAETMRKKHR
ncbi:hypothetical protein ACTU45_07820 [Streptomyces sp. 24-1644]